MSYVFTDSASEDLIDIWLYTQESWSEEQADAYQRKLHACCQRLAEGTPPGKSVDAPRGIKVLHCQHHYLFFQREEETVIALAVLHERMDLLARLRDRL